MGIADDWPYILMAQKLAATGHVAYNGWAAPMIGWRLYLGAAFIKLFGYSLTAARMSTLLVAIVLAFVLQRTLVRAGIRERNATLGTLAFVLSPLYLMLSVTFETDIPGLFAILICLYGCLRALQAPTSRAMIRWLCFATAANAIFGTARQIAWLGVLVMVPSTLWLLRAQRQVLIAGASAVVAGALFIFACLLWLHQQPYCVPQHLLSGSFSLATIISQFIQVYFEAPFLLLPIVLLFLPEIRRSRLHVLVIFAMLALGYTLLAIHQGHRYPGALLEPVYGDWVSEYGGYQTVYLKGFPPIFLHTRLRIFLTVASLGGMFGVFASLLRERKVSPSPDSPTAISSQQLTFLLAPFTIAYILLLIPATSGFGIFDRYLLAVLLVALLCLLRFYQEQVNPRLPFIATILVAMTAIYGVAVTHNMFAFYRARVALAAEIRSAGIPDTSVDNAWEFNMGVELQHTDHLNNPAIEVPAHAYVPTPRLPVGTCRMIFFDYVPHIRPLYGISFEPNACYGPAPFAPVTYSRWLASTPGTLYVVRYTNPSTH
jgi:hypothetical protein